MCKKKIKDARTNIYIHTIRNSFNVQLNLNKFRGIRNIKKSSPY